MSRALGGRTGMASMPAPIAFPPPITSVGVPPVPFVCYEESFDKSDGAGVGPDLDWYDPYGSTTLGTSGGALGFAGTTDSNQGGQSWVNIEAPYRDQLVSATLAVTDPDRAESFYLYARTDSLADPSWVPGVRAEFWHAAELPTSPTKWTGSIVAFAVATNDNFYAAPTLTYDATGTSPSDQAAYCTRLAVGDEIALQIVGSGSATAVDALVNGTVVASFTYASFLAEYDASVWSGGTSLAEMPNGGYAGVGFYTRRTSTLNPSGVPAYGSCLDNFSLCPVTT